MNTDNLISLSDNRSQGTQGFNTEVYDQIVRFLREHNRSSTNTASAYERDIRQFFEHTRDKHIEHLQKTDLGYSIEEFEDYQAYLIDNMKLSVSTSNRHITAISECMRHLHRRGLVDDIGFLDIRRPKAMPRSYDGLTVDEVMKAKEIVSSKGNKRTAIIKRELISFSLDTCARREECMSLKWSDFEEIEDNKVLVQTIAKGNKVMKRTISNERYKQLLQIKSDNSDRVFDIGESTVDRMMKDIREGLEINADKRYIVFHSIRKAGAQWIWEQTRDINQVSRALGHASIQTTELYINKEEDYGVMGVLSSMDRTDDDLYKQVTHEQLLQAIDRLGVDKQLFINLELQQTKT